jgi:hypothetical protein
MLKLVEECRGVGQLAREGQALGSVNYAISRYQGIAQSGLPVPGLHRLEGSIGVDSLPEQARRVGVNYALTLADGRVIGITLADASGRVLTEGHGPARCTCC